MKGGGWMLGVEGGCWEWMVWVDVGEWMLHLDAKDVGVVVEPSVSGEEVNVMDTGGR